MTGQISGISPFVNPNPPRFNRPITPFEAKVVNASSTPARYGVHSGGENIPSTLQINQVGLQYAAQAAQAAAAPGLAALETTVASLQESKFRDKQAPDTARLIDKAEASALQAISCRASKPENFNQIFASGSTAATMEVTDLALALSMLKSYGGADVTDDYNRLTRDLSELVLDDKLGDKSGFSHWEPNNSYQKVQQLRIKITEKLNSMARLNKTDLFTSVFNGEVMPAICQQLENKLGPLRLETWEKVNEAKGTISEAAASAAKRALLSYQSENGKETRFHSMMNQVRVAYHWAELTRSEAEIPAETPTDEAAKGLPGAPVGVTSPSIGPADLNAAGPGTTINVSPHISLTVNGEQKNLDALIESPLMEINETLKHGTSLGASAPARPLSLHAKVEDYDPAFTAAEEFPERYDDPFDGRAVRPRLSISPKSAKTIPKTIQNETEGQRVSLKKRGVYTALQMRNDQLSTTMRPTLVIPGGEPIRNGRREN
ncbi:hypothetical protein [Glaciimonas sp. PAMC28666]|uniref:hypothetical protein n=1 Tax=Glaciimonas sp. PAMC28666 TaxID=2807626 RepID=UPI001965C245|nr:hypothetical protein [Glaciimonas sp. PAMC28666]QRX82150.1 hypothetical protein JQN73_18900 [Glaciimonas sp. PAMC28666]